jgi:uncharacterized protein
MADSELSRLLHRLNPTLMTGEFVFHSLSLNESPPSSAIAWFREADGISVIAPASGEVERFAWISLGVESPLSSIGLTAAVATALAKAGIACNVVAAARHDHLFVPVDRAAEAIEILKRLQAES